MQSATFTGEVLGGQLHIQQPLGDFEGKQVLVTLVARDPSGHALSSGPAFQQATALRTACDAELLEDPGRIRMPTRGAATLNAQVISTGRQPPRIQADEE
jgi:hypothetical protein